MPELPEVETVRRGLAPVMEGARFTKVETRRPDLRVPFPDQFARRLQGKQVERLSRRAKYLLTHLDNGDVLIMHLGMSGSFRVEMDRKAHVPGEFHYPRGVPGPHDHVMFRMSSGATIIFNDPRRFGFMKLVPANELEAEPSLRALGPEPLGNTFNAQVLAQACSGKATSLKAALLDQHVVAGLGNIYVCEALYRAHLSPKRRASTLETRGAPNQRAEHLARAIRDVLNEAIAAGGSSLRDHRQTNGELGYFQHTFRVYDREGEPCPQKRCGGTIKRFVQNGRSTFWCPHCQT